VKAVAGETRKRSQLLEQLPYVPSPSLPRDLEDSQPVSLHRGPLETYEEGNKLGDLEKRCSCMELTLYSARAGLIGRASLRAALRAECWRLPSGGAELATSFGCWAPTLHSRMRDDMRLGTCY
jgi:hypothetical protein